MQDTVLAQGTVCTIAETGEGPALAEGGQGCNSDEKDFPILDRT